MESKTLSIFGFIILLLFACRNTKQIRNCDFRPPPFILPYKWTDTIWGKIEFFTPDGLFKNKINERKFWIIDANPNRDSTFFTIDSLTFCNDFQISLRVNGKNSLHKFSKFNLKERYYGKIRVTKIEGYVYNDSTYYSDNCNLILNGTIQ